ncbi:MAG: nitrate reductase associated protein [Microcoleaceae cyanobacterium]
MTDHSKTIHSETEHFATEHFEFEADFVESLRCIPMNVRYKLDTCGIKLKLEHWHQFSHEDRQHLVEQLVETPESVQAYRNQLQNLAERCSKAPLQDLPIDPHPPWKNQEEVPESVQQKAMELDVEVTLEDWKNLTFIQRFALIKLSRPSHENRNFLPAMQEFRLKPNLIKTNQLSPLED